MLQTFLLHDFDTGLLVRVYYRNRSSCPYLNYFKSIVIQTRTTTKHIRNHQSLHVSYYMYQLILFSRSLVISYSLGLSTGNYAFGMLLVSTMIPRLVKKWTRKRGARIRKPAGKYHRWMTRSTRTKTTTRLW